LQIEPGSEKARANLGIMEQRLGEVAIEFYGDARTAIAHFEEAKRLHEPINSGQGDGAKPLFEIHRDQAHDDLHLGRAFLALGQAAQAQRVFKEALGYYEEWVRADPKSTLAPAFVKEAHMCLGAAAFNLNDQAGAEEHFSIAVKMGHDQMASGPKWLSYKVDQVEVESAYADALIRLGRFADAEKHLMESMRFLRFVMAQRPDDSAFQPLLALVHEQLAIVTNSLNKPAEAKDNRLKALAIRNTLFEVDRSNLSRQAGLCWHGPARATLLKRSPMPRESARGWRRVPNSCCN
jgi:tetratricopeptide (TPR) repeat protein